jgi:hypothetical protein
MKYSIVNILNIINCIIGLDISDIYIINEDIDIIKLINGNINIILLLIMHGYVNIMIIFWYITYRWIITCYYINSSIRSCY